MIPASSKTPLLRLLSAVAAALLLSMALPGSSRAYRPQKAAPAYYLAFGDSLAYGVTYGALPADPSCRSRNAVGYVCVFYRYLEQVNPTFHLKNFAIPGLSSCELVHGAGSGSPCKQAFNSSQFPSPLATGIAFIRAHSGQTRVITLNTGGIDLLTILPAAVLDPASALKMLPGTLSDYQQNLDSAIQQLKRAAPTAKIIISTQFNVLGGIGSPPLPPAIPELGSKAVLALNEIVRAEGLARHVTVADVAAAFDRAKGGASTLTYMPEALASGGLMNLGNGIHATPTGYKVWARVLVRSANLGMPLRTKVAPSDVAPGGKEWVSGGTLFGSLVTIRVRKGSGRMIYRQTAGTDGGFSRALAAGAQRGTLRVRVCATGFLKVTVCRRLSFKVL